MSEHASGTGWGWLLAAVLVGAVFPAPVPAGGAITVASTTSTEQSGLFASLKPRFQEATGIEIRVIAVGTGQAMEIARRGDADHLFLHDPEAEAAFVEHGYGRERRDVMYNDFVLVGPAHDPARIADAEGVIEAFRRVARSESAFTSRGDDSGTHRAELRLWDSAGIEPAGRWYRELGAGMGQTLNTGAAMDAYVLTDRATWVSFENRQNLEILLDGDDALFNQYASVLIDPERHPHLKHDLAEAWHEWLLSAEGQAAIAAHELRGEQLFFPNADGR